MGQRPCCIGMHRFPGKSVHFYPAFVDGTSSSRAALILCPSHYRSLVEHYQLHAIRVDDESNLLAEQLHCALCPTSLDGEEDTMLFITAYAPDRQDFWGRVCDECGKAGSDGLLTPI